MADLATLTVESFDGLTGEPFLVVRADAAAAGVAPAHGGGGQADTPAQLTLAEVERLGAPNAPGMRAPFSLIFTGPPAPILAQGIRVLRHPRLGALELFLVSLGPGPDGARYQAIFS
jgi:hypothetical protein